MDEKLGKELDAIRKRIERIKAQLASAEADRDRLIRLARESGEALRTVADRAGVSHTWVAKLGRDATPNAKSGG